VAQGVGPEFKPQYHKKKKRLLKRTNEIVRNYVARRDDRKGNEGRQRNIQATFVTQYLLIPENMNLNLEGTTMWLERLDSTRSPGP
jgi:hypothetical protein